MPVVVKKARLPEDVAKRMRKGDVNAYREACKIASEKGQTVRAA